MTSLRVGSTNGGPSVSSLQEPHRNHTQGNGSPLFGKSIPSGRRTPSKRIPRCPVKPRIDLEALEESEEIEVSANSAGDHESSSKGGNVVVHKKSSKYRGVTKHRVTERYEAHLWDKTAYNSKQKKKGRQVYLGAYDEERAAAQAYDLAALKYWGPQTTINFKLENYSQQLNEMEKISKEEYLATLRRKSSGFSRGASQYRGVARHHHNGRWEARIGRVEGNKYLYLGTFNTEEEAAEAYDRAAIYYRKAAAVTNFELSRYPDLCDLYQDNSAKKVPKNKTTIKNSPMANTTTEEESSSGAAEDPEDSAKQIIDADMDSTVPDDDLFDEVVPVVECLPKLYTSGLHIDDMKDYKLEGFPSLPSQPDEFPGLGIEYDEMLAGFNVLDESPFPFDRL